MTLKEIIVEETIKEFFGNNELHKYDKDRIEHIADNIISRMDWQVIASGEIILDVDDVFISFPIIQGVEGLYSLGNINSSLFGKYMGKNIEIAVRVKDSKEKLNKTRKKD